MEDSQGGQGGGGDAEGGSRTDNGKDASAEGRRCFPAGGQVVGGPGESGAGGGQEDPGGQNGNLGRSGCCSQPQGCRAASQEDGCLGAVPDGKHTGKEQG